MSKFPFGSIIQDKDGNKRKVLGEAGDMRFLSLRENHDKAGFHDSFIILERLGYIEVKEPWKPEVGMKYSFVALDPEGACKITSIWVNDSVDHDRLSIGNCYNPDDDSCDRAVERVNKALKNQ